MPPTDGLLRLEIGFRTSSRPRGCHPSRNLRTRLHGDDDLALDTLLDVGDRQARDRSPKQQQEWRRVKRALLGDAFSETEYVDPVGPEERARLPLPFKGVLKALKHVAWKRAGFRPWETGS